MTTTFSRDAITTTPQLVINAGVIGFGFIGEVHVRAIRAAGGVVTAIAAKTINQISMYKIQRIQNCLPEPLLTEITNFIHNANWKYGWNSNGNMGFSHWNFNISKTGSENGLDISNHISGPASDVWKYLQSTYFPNTVLLRCYANAHTYGIEGYPHTDSKRSHGMTIVLYLNKTWKREWAEKR